MNIFFVNSYLFCTLFREKKITKKADAFFPQLSDLNPNLHFSTGTGTQYVHKVMPGFQQCRGTRRRGTRGSSSVEPEEIQVED